MLQAMRGKGIETYATYTSDEEREALPKECVALRIPHFKSKFKYASIKEVRSIIKKYRIDVIYASSTSIYPLHCLLPGVHLPGW